MLKLFLTFFKIGLFTFGGGYAMIPLIEEEISTFNIDAYTFSDFIAISESTPGPFALNIATFVGYTYQGTFGAIIATLGVLLPAFIVMLILAILLNKVIHKAFFKDFIKISTPLILGLILSSIIKITGLNLFNINSYKTIASDFSFNLVTIISLLITITLLCLYALIKKKKPSPFMIIGFSFICGISAYLINLL